MKLTRKLGTVVTLGILLMAFNAAAYARTYSISATPSSLNFSATLGGVTPASQNVRIGDSGRRSHSLSLHADQPWLVLGTTSGFTDSTISLGVSAVSLASGTYTGHVAVTSFGATDSPLSVTVTLVVAPAAAIAPAITGQPTSQTVVAGQSGTFSASASGTGPLNYQWTKNSAAISGATAATYTTPVTTSADNAAKFAVTVSNGAGSATSNAAMLTVNTPSNAPSITSQPASVTVVAGKSAIFSVVASGTGPLSYQWSMNGGPINGATATSYSLATAASDNNAHFTVTVSNAVSTVTSNVATLSVTTAATAPAITTQPASTSVTTGNTATFTVAASGTGPLSYQWNKNGAAIGGATSASFTTAATVSNDNNAQFAVTVSNASGNATSSNATLTVSPVAAKTLTTSVSSLSFGNTTVATSKMLSVTFTNSGNATVTISNVTVSGSSLTSTGVSNGLILAPSQTATLNVTFAPVATGSMTGSINVASDATNSPSSITASGMGIAAAAHSVSLTWSTATASVAGYNVYRATQTAGPFTKMNASLNTLPSFTDTAVASGQYFYSVTAVDSSNMESTFSSQATALIP